MTVPPTWSKEPPTEPGWYWMRGPCRADEPIVVLVGDGAFYDYNTRRTGVGMTTRAKNSWTRRVAEWARRGWEFWPIPIQPPETP